MEEQEFGQRDQQREREKRNKFRTKRAKLAIAKQVTDVRLLKVDKRKESLPTLREYLKWLMKKVDQKSEGELILDREKSVILNPIKRMVLVGNTGTRLTPHGT